MPGRLEMDEDISMEQKIWQVYNFGKRNVLRLDLNEPREGFCQRERGKSFHVDGLKIEKVQGSVVQGIWRLRVSEVEQSTGGCVKLETVTEIRWSSACNIFKAESVCGAQSYLINFMGLETIQADMSKEYCLFLSRCTMAIWASVPLPIIGVCR